MKYYYGFLTLILLCFQSLANESGIIYRQGDIKIEYNRQADEFIFVDGKDGKNRKEYPRFRYKDMILEKFSRIPLEDRGPLEDRLKLIKNTYRMADAAPEEVLTSALSEFDSINKSDEHGCGDSRIAIGEESPDFVAAVEISKLDVNHSGIFGLGEFKSAEFELNSNNDNPLHGIMMFSGVTDYEEREGYEGDDRGLTFGASFRTKLKFDNGEISVSYGSKVYTKLVSKPCGLYEHGGATYQRYCYRNEDGTVNQQALNRDDFDISVYRRIGDDKDTFIEVGTGFTIFDDNGMAASIQKDWHKATEDSGTIQYNNVNHMDRIISPKANVKIGKIFDLTDPDNKIALSSQAYTGGQVSYVGGNENFISLGGDLKITINDSDKDAKFPYLETRLYYDAEYTQLGEVNQKYGVETRANFYESNDSVVYMKVGAGIEDSVYDREYEKFGISPLHDNLDVQHYIGIGFEKKF